MHTSRLCCYTFSTIATAALLAGCSGGAGDTGGGSAFAPTSQISSQRLVSNINGATVPLVQGITCPIRKGDVPLASAASFAVLGSSTVTSTGLTVLDGNLGVSPGTSITGFGPGVVKDGTIYAGGPVPSQAQADLTTAYNYTAALKNPSQLPIDIGGTTIKPGVYNALSSLGITGTVTLDGQNKSNSVFIFQIPSTLTVGVKSTVRLARDANACNVFWQVGSSATLDTSAHFKGTIMAAVSISVGSKAKIRGRLLAESGAVTLINDKDNSFYLASDLNKSR
jgi:hypothetical protein